MGFPGSQTGHFENLPFCLHRQSLEPLGRAPIHQEAQQTSCSDSFEQERDCYSPLYTLRYCGAEDCGCGWKTPALPPPFGMYMVASGDFAFPDSLSSPGELQLRSLRTKPYSSTPFFSLELLSMSLTPCPEFPFSYLVILSLGALSCLSIPFSLFSVLCVPSGCCHGVYYGVFV